MMRSCDRCGLVAADHIWHGAEPVHGWFCRDVATCTRRLRNIEAARSSHLTRARLVVRVGRLVWQFRLRK